jgi:hypothetical protein
LAVWVGSPAAKYGELARAASEAGNLVLVVRGRDEEAAVSVKSTSKRGPKLEE